PLLCAGLTAGRRAASSLPEAAGGKLSAMLSAAPTTATSAVALHVRQRELVAASLIAVPSATRPTHRRWV
ncbi:MAG: hypothetical protein QOJ21_3536, partial [Solirubrobacteraceae bacterium]|nr:hypothetical protein [Solirubrobacteraceae bacterium]